MGLLVAVFCFFGNESFDGNLFTVVDVTQVKMVVAAYDVRITFQRVTFSACFGLGTSILQLLFQPRHEIVQFVVHDKVEEHQCQSIGPVQIDGSATVEYLLYLIHHLLADFHQRIVVQKDYLHVVSQFRGGGTVTVTLSGHTFHHVGGHFVEVLAQHGVGFSHGRLHFIFGGNGNIHFRLVEVGRQFVVLARGKDEHHHPSNQEGEVFD